MFTGLVQDIGIVRTVKVTGTDSLELTIKTKLPLATFSRGASIACNGVCLTVTEARAAQIGVEFCVAAGFETLAKTSLRTVSVGDTINLEPALKMGDPLGGHVVLGHVDGVCTIENVEVRADGFRLLTLALPSEWENYVVPKGSIALRGVSLTIAAIRSRQLDVMLIPETLSNTNLSDLKKGSLAEIEFDTTVKSVASLLENMLPQFLSKSIK